MPDAVIKDFFQERKEARLKKLLKPDMTEDEQQAIHAACDEEFAPANWLPSAAKRAGQIARATHPSTFSHPSTGIGDKNRKKNTYVSPVVYEGEFKANGFLCSGNVAVGADALGNAAALDVHKFLSLSTADGELVLEHIANDTPLAKQLLTIPTADYQTLKQGFMAMAGRGQESITSTRLKQVFFPVEDGYHLLSTLTPSGIVFEQRQRLDTLRFGEETKLARERKNKGDYHPGGYKEIYGLTTLGFGGTKPQNISVLNNRYGGKAYLLLSTPPQLEKRTVRFPNASFFEQTLRYRDCRDIFQKLHKLYGQSGNNLRIRQARDRLYLTVLDRIIERMYQVRSMAEGRFNPECHRTLSLSERVWLLPEHQTTRQSEDDWLDDITKAITRFIFAGYKSQIGENHYIMLSDAEAKALNALIQQHREILR